MASINHSGIDVAYYTGRIEELESKHLMVGLNAEEEEELAEARSHIEEVVRMEHPEDPMPNVGSWENRNKKKDRGVYGLRAAMLDVVVRGKSRTFTFEVPSKDWNEEYLRKKGYNVASQHKHDMKAMENNTGVMPAKIKLEKAAHDGEFVPYKVQATITCMNLKALDVWDEGDDYIFMQVRDLLLGQESIEAMVHAVIAWHKMEMENSIDE